MAPEGGGVGKAPGPVLLSPALLDAPMWQYFRRKFQALDEDELHLRIEEALRFLFIAHACRGSIPVSREIDDIWHAWILQTQEYMGLCDRLPTRTYIHHSSNDYLRLADPDFETQASLADEVHMLALYRANFGPFEASRARHWRLVQHLTEGLGWPLEAVNQWLDPAEVPRPGPSAEGRRRRRRPS